MKYIYLFSLALVCHISFGQVLDPYKDWFGLTGYFNQEEVAKHGIKKIRMDISNKLDDKIFYDKGEFLEYEFNRDGTLAKASRRIPVSRGHDTSYISYQYDPEKRILSQEEHQGPFEFIYQYIYLNSTNYRSLKIRPDSNRADTLYDRTHVIESEKSNTVERIGNLGKKPFMEVKKGYTKDGQLQDEEIIYLFNKNEIHTTYFIEDQKLIGKHYQKAFGEKKDLIWKYQYNSSLLELIEVYKNGTLLEKIAFTYAGEIPTAIILRNYQDKFVRIYRCDYEKY